jgi:hypothetical protein
MYSTLHPNAYPSKIIKNLAIFAKLKGRMLAKSAHFELILPPFDSPGTNLWFCEVFNFLEHPDFRPFLNSSICRGAKVGLN